MLPLFQDLSTASVQNSLVFLDVDGTLVPDGTNYISSPLLKKIEELKKTNTVVLLSNAPTRERIARIARALGITYIDTRHKKPSRKIMKLLPKHGRKTTVVIGDKFLTDGLFAKNIGAQFLKVKRLAAPQEKFVNRLIYILDDMASFFTRQ